MASKSFKEVDILFRRVSGEVFSTLYTIYGPEYYLEVEDAIQESFLAALNTWPFKGIPTEPEKWIYVVARNRLINILKRRSRLKHVEDVTWREQDLDDGLSGDDYQFNLLIGICNAHLSDKHKLLFALKHIGGFGPEQICKVVAVSKEAVYKSCQRTQQYFRKHDRYLTSSQTPFSKKELDTALAVIYLMFNRGYDCEENQSFLSQEVCYEAIHLAGKIKDKYFDLVPEVVHLLALMYLLSSRFEARFSSDNFISLSHQDRTLWDMKMVSIGLQYLDEYQPEVISDYYIEACIAAQHSTAASFDETNWKKIIELYQILYRIKPTDMVRINLAIAIAQVDQDGALDLLKRPSEKMKNDYWYHVVCGDIYSKIDRKLLARQSYDQACRLTQSDGRKTILNKKISDLG